MSVSGNTILTDPDIFTGEGNGLFIISTTTPFNVLTMNGINAGRGGFFGLSCDPNAPIITTSTTTSSTTTLAPTGINTIYTHFEAL